VSSEELYPFTHMVVDDDAIPLRRFRSKREAGWFVENKPDLKVVKLDVVIKTVKELNDEFTAKHGEPLF
jgi:hypothetical protein